MVAAHPRCRWRRCAAASCPRWRDRGVVGVRLAYGFRSSPDDAAPALLCAGVRHVRRRPLLPLADASGSAPQAVLVRGSTFGSNVLVINPTMPQSKVEASLNAISKAQVSNQFGSERKVIFFEPGIYGSLADPLIFQVGYYTEVAGLGAMPEDTVINGAIDVFNQCAAGVCNGTDNFWRSLSNLTLNVELPKSPPSMHLSRTTPTRPAATTVRRCGQFRRRRRSAA